MSDVEEYDVEYAERTGMVEESVALTIPEGTVFNGAVFNGMSPEVTVIDNHIHDMDVASYYAHSHTATDLTTRQYVDNNVYGRPEAIDEFDNIILKGVQENINYIQQTILSDSEDRENAKNLILETIRRFLQYSKDTNVITDFDISFSPEYYNEVIRVARNSTRFHLDLPSLF